MRIHEVGVLDAVAIHHREAVDVGFLGDGAGFGGSHVRRAASDVQREYGGKREELCSDMFHRAGGGFVDSNERMHLFRESGILDLGPISTRYRVAERNSRRLLKYWDGSRVNDVVALL